MSMFDAVGRVQAIRSTLTQLTDPGSPVPGGPGPSSFNRTLSEAIQGSLASSPAAQASGTAAAGAVTGEKVAADARKYVGVPYVWGGTDPATGLDCSGFVQRVYQDLGIQLPRVVHDQMTQGTPVASLADAQPGDLLVSFGGEHVAIYLGDGKAIDAPEPGRTVQVRDAWEKYSNLTAIRRIVPDAGPGPAVAGLDAAQARYAQVIVDRVRDRGLPAQAAVDAISTALQESSLRMYWNPQVAGSQALAPDRSAIGTDGYSVGLFQQQVNGSRFSWGTVADAMDPVKSTDMFLNRLTAIPGWASLPTTAADQAVQGSAYPDAYAKWEGQASQIVAALSRTGA
ncbi:MULTISPECIES: C40 family peptidase [Arthrobacter]|uniref:C40 family peptidase n=2 Tax=Arthrobacter TaxID=1663 RepID=A0ABU9KID4_9MICC|nr:C40 family peptidase [Arthrobacter sp. YJM1]MDP5226339.1 C40 family peptidase [Arthrobacter sp. YJM1]